MSRRPPVEVYPIERSPFYRMGRLRDLATLLNSDLRTIQRLARDRREHYWRMERQLGGKQRLIVCPFGIMRQIQERIQSLCNRIEQPKYLQSPRRGHTAIGNAGLHSRAKMVAKLDIRQFYPSTTDEHVFRFFKHRMKMRDEIAGLITKLSTVDGKLPFGSPLSPVLCTLVHRDLFDQVNLYCHTSGLVMSLWVDDITISGDTVVDSVIWMVKQFIHVKGLKYHKVKVRALSRGVVVTGHFLTQSGMAPANKHHVGVRDSLRELDNTTEPTARLSLVRSLIGKTNHARGIYAPESSVRARLDRRRDWLHTERRRLEKRPVITNSDARIIATDPKDTALPWEDPVGDVHSWFLSALAVSVPLLPR
jgi:RNA-directed DNA polymerase